MRTNEISRVYRVTLEWLHSHHDNIAELFTDMTLQQSDMFKLLFDSFYRNLVYSSYFENMRISDSFYTMVVRKDVNDLITITCKFNPSGNHANRFTK